MADAYRPSPGVSAEVTNTPTAFLKSDHVVQVPITIDEDARDAGNTPTTTLRSGLVLGRITESGKFKEYVSTNEDGSETAVCILRHEARVLDSDGTACDASGVGVIHGYVDKSKLIGIDADGKADLAHVIFDDDILKEA